MGRFAESLGIWEITINGTEYKLEPSMEDVLDYRKAMSRATDARKRKVDLGIIDQSVMTLFERMMIRKEPNMSPADRQNLQIWMVANLNYLNQEVTIALKQGTKGQFEASKKEAEELFEEDDEPDQKKN